MAGNYEYAGHLVGSDHRGILTSRKALEKYRSQMKTYMCVICGFVYAEAAGWPDDGIEAGTRWQDVSETWTCPDCGAQKSDFDMIEIDPRG